CRGRQISPSVYRSSKIMDMVFFYRLIDAVRDSLDRAGRPGFTLHRAERHELWLDLGWLQDCLDEAGHECLPLMWEGRSLPAHDALRIHSRSGARRLWRCDRSGGILLRNDALVAAVTVLPDDGIKDTFVIVGERAPGALQRLVDEYGAYAQGRQRRRPWITVIGGDPLPRP